VTNRRTGRRLCRTTRATLGDAAELEALKFLEQQGLRLVTRNFRCRSGELDLVMLDGACLAIIEVRFRSGTFVDPALSVDARKQLKLASAASFFLAGNQKFCDLAVRFDVVAVGRASDARGRIQWIRDAFRV
jgi:putative endonuclease